MEINLILSVMVFVVTFIVILVNGHKKIKKSKYEKLWFFGYIIGKFKLDKKKIKYKRMNLELSFINAIMMSFVTFAVLIIPLGRLWIFLIAFLIMFPLIYAVYEIYGAYLIKKGWRKKNV